MPSTTPFVNGKYRLVSWNEPMRPVPAEKKGVHYLCTNLSTYKEAELELKLGLGEGSWPLEGKLKVSPSQWFSVIGSVAAGHPNDAEGILVGNKRRVAWFNAHHESGRIELSVGYSDAKQTGLPVQIFSFQETPLNREEIEKALTAYLSGPMSELDLYSYLGAHSELFRDEVMESFNLLFKQATLENYPGLNQIRRRHEFVVKARKALAEGKWKAF